jgi:hypothetical protein
MKANGGAGIRGIFRGPSKHAYRGPNASDGLPRA